VGVTIRLNVAVNSVTMTKRVEVALVQLKLAQEREAERLKRVDTLLAETKGADLVLLPELWSVNCPGFSMSQAKAESLEGPTVSFLREKAVRLGSYLLGGTIIEKDGESLYNSAILIDPQGTVISKYRKSHLLGYRSEERRTLTPGNLVVTAMSDFGCLGIAVCYDLRFPEVFRSMAERGAEAFLITAAWPWSRAEAWEALCAARAVENQGYTIACDACGRGFLGRSMVIDPWGVRTASLGTREGLLRTEVDLQEVREFRAEFPAWSERRLERGGSP